MKYNIIIKLKIILQLEELVTETDKQTSNDLDVVPTNNSDKDMIKMIVLNIMEDIMKKGNLFKNGFIEYEHLRIKPLFRIRYLVKEKSKVQQKQK